MSRIPILADVIAWPFYVMGGVGILIVVALVAALIALTAAIIKRRKK